jgi:hypothetical protein
MAMELRTDLIKKTEANRTRKDLANTSININDIEKLFDAEYNWGSDELWEIQKKIKSIDESIKAGRIRKVSEAQKIRTRLVQQGINIMVRYEYLDYQFIKDENIKLTQMLERYHEHYSSTLYLEELILQYGFVKAEVLEQAEDGRELQQSYDSETKKVHNEQGRLQNEQRKCKPGTLLEPTLLRHELKENEKEIQRLKKEFLEGGISYRIETICFNLIYDRKYDTEIQAFKYEEKDNPFGTELEREIWKLTPSAQKN